MSQQKKKRQLSNGVAINNLQQAFNALLNKLEERNTEYLLYFGAVAHALAKVDARFVGPDGKPVDIYGEFILRRVSELEAAASAANEAPTRTLIDGDAPVFTVVSGEANANT